MTSTRRVPKEERWLRLADPTESRNPERELDDEALIDAVLARDVRRAAQLHDRLVSVIDATLYRLLGQRERDHDDLVQATFEQIVMTLVRGKYARGCSLTTWASTVAAHVAYNSMRSNRRARRVFDPINPSEAAHPRAHGDVERAVAVKEQIRIAQEQLRAMKPERAMALILHDVLGHGLADVAAMLDISVSAAQSRLVRGRRELQGRLDHLKLRGEGP